MEYAIGRNEKILHVNNPAVCADISAARPFGAEQAAQVRRYHESFPTYSPTDLVHLDGLAGELGLGEIRVKDESSRFGLNAFKGLGGSYCVGRVLAERAEFPAEELTYDRLRQDDVKEAAKDLTLVTATDGNHGRGLAWTARELGIPAVVYLPKGSSLERLENIRSLGAQAEITELNYDDTVRYAAQCEKERGWVLVQDTAWPGYEEIPAHIMQGYTTLAYEIAQQLGEEKPTHLFLQAGVGSFAGAVLGSFAALWGEERPVTVIMEPDQADCIYRSAKADDGKLHFVTGDMNSMMAGLCCGEPCTISWEIINAYADGFVSCGDEYSARGMRLLGKPVEGDTVVVSGESGAVGAGVLEALMTEERLKEAREALGLDENSRVLLISTEGDTDQENYRKVLAE